MSVQDKIREESTIRREDHAITAEYDIEIPQGTIDHVHDEYGHVDAEIRCAKAVARVKFKNDHDVPFNDPDLYAEKQDSALEPGHVRYKVVAIRS